MLKTIYTLKYLFVLFLLQLTFFGFGANKNEFVAPVAAFSASATTTCLDSIVTFTDQSTNAPTSWTWTFSPVEVTFHNGTNANSQNPQVSFDSTKIYDVTLTVTNVDSSNATTKKNYVVGTGTVPYFEGFRTIFPDLFPPTDWALINPDALQGWTDVLLSSGTPHGNPTHIARMDNYNYDAAGQLDELVMPAIDLTGIANPQLIFYVAYAAFDATHFEGLHIEYSTDCGVTFNPTTYDKEHLDLMTVSNY